MLCMANMKVGLGILYLCTMGVWLVGAAPNGEDSDNAEVLLRRMLMKLDEELSTHNAMSEEQAQRSADDVIKRLLATIQSHNPSQHVSSNQVSEEQEQMSAKRMMGSLFKRDHCGPLNLDDLCTASDECCCNYSCRRWRCKDVNIVPLQ